MSIVWAARSDARTDALLGGRDGESELSADQAREALAFLGLALEQPSRGYLESLQRRFRERVTFESASRIVRSATIADPAERPTRPGLFWRCVVREGIGGTCSELSAAYHGLLRALGFDCSLTLNDWLHHPNFHASVLVRVDGKELVSDVGTPYAIHVPLPITGAPSEIAGRTEAGDRYQYAIRPMPYARHRLANHSSDWHLDNDEMYVLSRRPISQDEYDEHLVAGYCERGRLIRHLLLFRRLPDGDQWRYWSREGLTRLTHCGWRPVRICGERPRALASIFELPFELVADALRILAAAGEPVA